MVVWSGPSELVQGLIHSPLNGTESQYSCSLELKLLKVKNVGEGVSDYIISLIESLQLHLRCPSPTQNL